MSEMDPSRASKSLHFYSLKTTKFHKFLARLNEGQEYASDLETSPWEFAIALEEAFGLEVNSNDLRWMIQRGWINCQPLTDRCLESQTKSAGLDRRIQLTSESRFVIAEPGRQALMLCQVYPMNAPPSVVTAKPVWDRERHELTVLGQVVKRFRWPASNQERILEAFEEEKWPAKIDDPLPPGNGLTPKRRLSDTIKCLNRNQAVNLLRFRGDGTGEGVLWDLCSDSQQLLATE